MRKYEENRGYLKISENVCGYPSCPMLCRYPGVVDIADIAEIAEIAVIAEIAEITDIAEITEI